MRCRLDFVPLQGYDKPASGTPGPCTEVADIRRGVPHKELLVVKARRERDLQSSKDLTMKKTDERNKLRFFVKRSPEKVLSIIES